MWQRRLDAEPSRIVDDTDRHHGHHGHQRLKRERERRHGQQGAGICAERIASGTPPLRALRSCQTRSQPSSPTHPSFAGLALTVVASGPDESTSATPTQRPAMSAEANARRMRLQGSSSPRLGGADSGSKPPLPYPISAGAFWFCFGWSGFILYRMGIRYR